MSHINTCFEVFQFRLSSYRSAVQFLWSFLRKVVCMKLTRFLSDAKFRQDFQSAERFREYWHQVPPKVAHCVVLGRKFPEMMSLSCEFMSRMLSRHVVCLAPRPGRNTWLEELMNGLLIH